MPKLARRSKNITYNMLQFIDFNSYIIWFNLCIVLFSAGLFGAIFNNQHFLHVLLNFEIMLTGIVLMYIGFSLFFTDPKGQIYALVVFVIATAEACVGLSLSLSYFKNKNSIELSSTYESGAQKW